MIVQSVTYWVNGFFTWLWRASWEGSVLVVLVLLVQGLLRRQLTPHWRHALWVLVVLRLALPCSVRSPISLFSWFEPQSPTGPAPAMADAVPLGAKPSDSLAAVVPQWS